MFGSFECVQDGVATI